MPRRPRPLPAALGVVFSSRAALAAGVGANRLRARDLEAPFHGVRRRGGVAPTEQDDEHPTAWELARSAEKQKAEAFATVMTHHMFFAGRTAAILYEAPIDPGPDLHVGVLAPARSPRGAGVRGVKVAARLANIHTHEGLRMTTPATTWAMLATELSVRELVALGDWFVRVPRDRRGRAQPHRQLTTTAQLAHAITAGRRPGIAKLREALPLIRVGSSSTLESEFRLDARAAGLPEPELDVEIRDAAATLLGITELVYPGQRVAVEIEGDHHRTSRKQWMRDIDKYTSYAAEGWEVVRLTSAHIRGSRPRAVEIVRDVLLRRGWQSLAPSSADAR